MLDSNTHRTLLLDVVSASTHDIRMHELRSVYNNVYLWGAWDPEVVRAALCAYAYGIFSKNKYYRCHIISCSCMEWLGRRKIVVPGIQTEHYILVSLVVKWWSLEASLIFPTDSFVFWVMLLATTLLRVVCGKCITSQQCVPIEGLVFWIRCWFLLSNPSHVRKLIKCANKYTYTDG